MKYQLFKTSEGFEAEIYDEKKMIPDPQFQRRFQWHDYPLVPPPQLENESEADYKARVKTHAAELKHYLETMEAESTRLYNAELLKTAPAKVEEKVF